MNHRLSERLWRKIIGQQKWIAQNGRFRERELQGFVDRPNYAYGMLRAADTAAYFGLPAITVCEFGVATGNGLLNMAQLKTLIEEETNVGIRVFGFDTGKGLPPVSGHKDHPELWGPGDFSMGDPDELRKKLAGRADLVLGDIAETIGPFRDSLTAEAPLGFVSIDVDIYSGTVSALQALTGDSSKYLPAISYYFDDVSSYFSNMASGELCAIAEHNKQLPLRPIDIDRSLPGWRRPPNASWYKHMYVAHILDHPARMSPQARRPLGLADHLRHMGNLS